MTAKLNHVELNTPALIDRICVEFDEYGELRPLLLDLVTQAEKDLQNQFNRCVADLLIDRQERKKNA